MIQESIRRVVSLEPGTCYVYRQHSLNCNPAEKNSAVQNVYLIAEEVSVNDIAAANNNNSISTVDNILHEEAISELVSHLVSE